MICVWHSKNRGQINIPLSGLPQNVTNKSYRNQSSPRSRNTTHKMIQVWNMYRKTCDLELQLDLHLGLFSHLFPQSEPKCPTGSTGLARISKKPLKSSPRVSKYGPPSIKVAPKGVQIQPAGPKNMFRESQRGKRNLICCTVIEMAPKGVHIQPAVLKICSENRKV